MQPEVRAVPVRGFLRKVGASGTFKAGRAVRSASRACTIIRVIGNIWLSVAPQPPTSTDPEPRPSMFTRASHASSQARAGRHGHHCRRGLPTETRTGDFPQLPGKSRHVSPETISVSACWADCRRNGHPAECRRASTPHRRSPAGPAFLTLRPGSAARWSMRNARRAIAGPDRFHDSPAARRNTFPRRHAKNPTLTPHNTNYRINRHFNTVIVSHFHQRSRNHG